MSVSRPNPNDQVIQALKDGLGRFIASSDPLRNILTGAQPGKYEALPVWAVELKDIVSGNWQNWKRKGWRFLAVDADGRGIVVNVTVADGRPPRIAGVQRGPHVQKAIDAVRTVKEPPGAPADVELAFLNIPGLLTEMLWVKPKTSNLPGWVVPYRTLIDKLKAQPFFPLADFFDAAKPLALDRLQEDDGLESAV